MRIFIFFLSLLAVYFWALQDRLLWGVIFEADKLWQYDSIYHRGWFISLVGYCVLGFLIFMINKKWKQGLLYVLMVYTFAMSGLNDALYYWVAGLTVPDVLPWLDEHPLILFSPVTNVTLLFSVALWLLFWLLVVYFIIKRNHDPIN